ncbi:hypothetical protein QZH41_010231, partial [Actinostola sp. cb2023]
MLLHYAGPDADEIFDTLPDTGEDDDFDKAIEKLNQYFSPKTNTTYENPFSREKRELERLEKLDIIEEITGPTPWVSPIVVVPKSSGEVRICFDMREANKTVEREKHLMPTIDDLVADLNGATVFSKLDLSSGYQQLELDPESRHITTFSTHVGLRRYKRLMFGINAASEIFQNAIEQILPGLPGSRNISDDIIVYGKNQKEHDKNLRQVLERLMQHNVRLNRDKCSFSKNEIKFYGHIFSSEGIKPDPSKIEAINNMSQPTNVSEVRPLLGLTQYVSRFIPEYATITAPLRTLTLGSGGEKNNNSPSTSSKKPLPQTKSWPTSIQLGIQRSLVVGKWEFTNTGGPVQPGLHGRPGSARARGSSGPRAARASPGKESDPLRAITQSSESSSARLGSARLGSARLGSARLGSARLGSARLGSARLGSARLGSARLGSARLGSARLGSARLGSARLGSARLGSARLGSARLGSARLGSARLGSGSARLGSGSARLGSARLGSARLGSARLGSARRLDSARLV